MSTVPPALQGFCDDAALFPPASVPMAQAVAAHHDHHQAWYGDIVGPFVCPAPRVAQLHEVLAGASLTVALTLPSGPGGLAAALAECARLGTVHVSAVEMMLPDGVAARDALAMMSDHLPDGVTGYLEVPRGVRTQAVLDALAGTGYRAKFRTGGLEPGDHPGERELAGAVLGAVARGIPFKCTAGLHHAVRHTDGQLEQHGFVNVLLAADAAIQGAGIGAVASLLALRSGEEVAREVSQAAAAGRLSAARTSFVSFGTCSISDPVTDLVALGLLRRPGTEPG
jgi:hypothetical protein